MRVPLAPIHVANTLSFPLLAVLRMNSQAITQYCKVPQGFEGSARRPAPRVASERARRHASQCACQVADLLHSDRAAAITCALSHEDVPGGLT